MKFFSDEVEEEEEESEEEENENKESENAENEVTDYINPDSTVEERQAEFIEAMKERFVDGLDPDFGRLQLLMGISLKLSDYESLNDQFDTESDRQQTEDWFDDDDDDVEPEQPGDEDSEDDYMKMDLTKL